MNTRLLAMIVCFTAPAFAACVTSGVFNSPYNDLLKCQRARTSAEGRPFCQKVVDAYDTGAQVETKTVSRALSIIARDDRKKGRYERSLNAYDRALALDPSDALSVKGRGETHLAMGNYREAATDFRHLQSMNWVPTIPTIMLGAVYQKMGRHQEAVDHLVLTNSYPFRGREEYINDALEFYGLDSTEKIKAYKNGTYTPPQLAQKHDAATPDHPIGIRKDLKETAELIKDLASGKRKSLFPFKSEQSEQKRPGQTELSQEPPSKLFPPDHISNYQPTDPNFSLGDDLNF